MALIFSGQSACALCGQLLQEGEKITGLPASAFTDHPLHPYFDRGFHLECFDNWDKKAEALNHIKEGMKQFKDTNYYKEMVTKYGKPKWMDEYE